MQSATISDWLFRSKFSTFKPLNGEIKNGYLASVLISIARRQHFDLRRSYGSCVLRTRLRRPSSYRQRLRPPLFRPKIPIPEPHTGTDSKNETQSRG
ncbi:hypothetical protein J1N35_007059 [Gossypium stocksii]|uniref:Uncharacterized protein n=1 Tax=Gossypium stocksii TaxID=47602 RepID=A0A9D3W5X3_9ROSI|nr:hypothetical protein J1N35_007059 [Gossypium stocksii]